jgi:hypothetical protein
VEDSDESGWCIVVTTNPRVGYKMQEMDDTEMYLLSELGNHQAHDRDKENN